MQLAAISSSTLILQLTVLYTSIYLYTLILLCTLIRTLILLYSYILLVLKSQQHGNRGCTASTGLLVTNKAN